MVYRCGWAGDGAVTPASHGFASPRCGPRAVRVLGRAAFLCFDFWRGAEGAHIVRQWGPSSCTLQAVAPKPANASSRHHAACVADTPAHSQRVQLGRP